MASIARAASRKVFERNLQNYEPKDPLYETYVDSKGRERRRKVRTVWRADHTCSLSVCLTACRAVGRSICLPARLFRSLSVVRRFVLHVVVLTNKRPLGPADKAPRNQIAAENGAREAFSPGESEFASGKLDGGMGDFFSSFV